MAASSIPAAKAALLAAIEARPALTGITVEWGVTAELPEDAEFITIADARDVRRDWSSFDEFEENYLLRAFVNTLDPGGTNQGAEERMWLIVAEVEAAVRADLTLGGTVADVRPDAVIPTTGPFDLGWWAQAEVMFACRAFGRP